MDPKWDGVIDLAMVALSKHVEEYEEYVEHDEKMDASRVLKQENEEHHSHETDKRESQKKVLHHDEVHPCPLNTLIEDPSEGGSDIKEILVSSDKPLFINSSLLPTQEEKLKLTLEKHTEAFPWDYRDMRGIHPSICTHHIYTKDVNPKRQGQRIIILSLRDFI